MVGPIMTLNSHRFSPFDCFPFLFSLKRYDSHLYAWSALQSALTKSAESSLSPASTLFEYRSGSGNSASSSDTPQSSIDMALLRGWIHLPSAEDVIEAWNSRHESIELDDGTLADTMRMMKFGKIPKSVTDDRRWREYEDQDEDEDEDEDNEDDIEGIDGRVGPV